MPPNVRHRLLDDAKRRRLDRRGQLQALLRSIHADRRHGSRCRQSLLDRGDEATVVEHRWSQVVGDIAQLPRSGVEARDESGCGVRGSFVAIAREGLDCRRGQPEAGERGGEVVVQVATQPLALLFAREHDPRPRVGQLG